MNKHLLYVIGLLVAAVFIPTIAELGVAVVNKFITYPAGHDASLLAYWIYFKSLLIIILFVVFGMVYRKVEDRQTKTIAVIIFALGMVVIALTISSLVPNSWCKHELKIYSCEELSESGYVRY